MVLCGREEEMFQHLEKTISCFVFLPDCPSSRSNFESLASVYSGLISGSVWKLREVSPDPEDFLKNK